MLKIRLTSEFHRPHLKYVEKVMNFKSIHTLIAEYTMFKRKKRKKGRETGCHPEC